MDNSDESIIIIRFAAPSSVFYELEVKGTVFPGQMIVIGSYLLEKGNELVRMAEQIQRQKQEEHKIALPKPNFVVSK